MEQEARRISIALNQDRGIKGEGGMFPFKGKTILQLVSEGCKRTRSHFPSENRAKNEIISCRLFGVERP
jgi:hypothetical protein